MYSKLFNRKVLTTLLVNRANLECLQISLYEQYINFSELEEIKNEMINRTLAKKGKYLPMNIDDVIILFAKNQNLLTDIKPIRDRSEMMASDYFYGQEDEYIAHIKKLEYKTTNNC